jgi:hypothetical protein
MMNLDEVAHAPQLDHEILLGHGLDWVTEKRVFTCVQCGKEIRRAVKTLGQQTPLSMAGLKLREKECVRTLARFVGTGRSRALSEVPRMAKSS